MEIENLHPQYLLDQNGNKSFVVLPIEDYEGLLEDLYDLTIMAERRDETKITFNDFEKGLKEDGLI